MEKDSHAIKFTPWFLMLIGVYFIAGIFLAGADRYEGLNANTIGYFTSAYEYAKGNFKDAVNGFWPPLIPWLAALFIKFGITPLTATKIVNLFTGFFLILGVRSLSYRFDISTGIRNILLFSLVPIVLSYTTIVFSDLLFLCLLVFYLNIVFGEEYSDRLKNGVYCGILGAIAYFAKHSAFPFFVVHFSLMNMLHYFRKTTGADRKNILRTAIAGLVVFCVISSVWVAAISIKYNYFTLGTVGDYVVRLIGPENKAVPEFYETEADDPPYWAGLLKPSYAYETALSAWDDPTNVSKKYVMGRATLWSDPEYLAKNTVKNIFKIIQIIFVKFFSFLSIPIILIYFLFCLQPLKKLILRSDILYPLITLMLYSMGLTLFIVHLDNVRYFWLDNILLLLMAGQILTVLFRNEFFSNNSRRNILTGVVILSFLYSPVTIVFQKPARGKKLYALAKELKENYNIQGNIATNARWGDTLQVAYNLKYNFNTPIYDYGMTQKGQSDEAVLNELKAHNITYFFVWGESSGFFNYKDITDGRVPDLKIYYIKE